MTTPPELLEQSLDAFGDTLYRLALLAAGDEGRAAGLLRDLAGQLAAPDAPPLALDEPDLIARLVAVARADEERAARSRAAAKTPRAARANLFAPFALHHLPLEQRLALGLHLLLGYDGARLGRALASEPAAARAALIEGARALGPAAGVALTDRVSGEQCAGVREILADPGAGLRHSAAVRGHLAGCGPCRAFDQAWVVILQQVEAALRGALRERTLPTPLRERMLALAAPTRARRAPSWRLTRLALAPAAVLALIVAMVLPGFMREPVSVVERDPGPPVDAQALITKSLARHSAPPERGGVWHGRYETLWYFNDDVYAPIRADVWLDASNPARHRLQLAHRDGGAPYELQIGDGVRRLAYALDAAYAPALYGSLPTDARVEAPALLEQPLDAAGQQRARDERLRSGPWSLPPAYLLQAQQAGDLRLLGRQRDGGRVVQILSFSGVSPLGLPIDAPGATAERVTVLLALDSEDGLLRSATELAGPAGTAQTGRVTWRLVEEQWLSGFEQSSAAFDIERAWTGIGDFSEAKRAISADVAMPLVATRAVGDPAGLLSRGGLPFWMPASAPPGVERALLLWGERDRQLGDGPRGLVYLGEGRRLIVTFNSSSVLAGERFAIGPWQVSLRPGRGQRYAAFITRTERAPGPAERGLFDASANMLIDAVGFTRAELEELIAGMAPFDLAALEAQEGLFVSTVAGNPARLALLAAAYGLAQPPAGQASHLTSRWFVRQAPDSVDLRRDPYHQPFYEGRPQVIAAEEWQAGAGDALAFYVETRNPVGGEALERRYTDGKRYWRYLAPADALESWPPTFSPYTIRLPRLAGAALDLLNQPGELALERLPGGSSLVRHSEAARTSPRYGQSVLELGPAEPHLFDLEPITMTTELELSPTGEAVALRVYAEGLEGARRTRNLVESYELVSRELVPVAETPVDLREGAPPAAAFVREFGFEQRSTQDMILQREEFNQALGWVDVPLYVPAEGAAVLLAVEEGALTQPGVEVSYADASHDTLREAIARRLAMRLSYRAPAGEYTPASYDISITQGPAGPLTAFLRSSHVVPWDASEPISLTVAGNEVEAWYGTGARSYVIVDLGATLLLIDSARPIDDPELRAIIAGLQQAPR